MGLSFEHGAQALANYLMIIRQDDRRQFGLFAFR